MISDAELAEIEGCCRAVLAKPFPEPGEEGVTSEEALELIGEVRRLRTALAGLYDYTYRRTTVNGDARDIVAQRKATLAAAREAFPDIDSVIVQIGEGTD